MSVAIGIDVGGTRTRLAVVGRDGRVLACDRFETHSAASYEPFLARVGDGIDSILGNANVPARAGLPIAVALPGPLDRTAGSLRRSVNVPFLEGRPIVADLADRFGVCVTPCTDAEAATFGEYKIGETAGRRFAHLRIGTGVALGVVLGGRLHPFDDNRTTHLPLLVVDRSSTAPLCRCGLLGCLEAIIGEESADQRPRGAAWGTPSDRVVDSIAEAIIHVAREFRIEVTVLGGGFATAHAGLLEAVTRSVARLSPAADVGPVVRACRLGDDAGVVGAALLAIP